MTMRAFWDTEQRSLIVTRRFRAVCCLHRSDDEGSTHLCIPEGCHFLFVICLYSFAIRIVADQKHLIWLFKEINMPQSYISNLTVIALTL
jgi:hypothetical protein